MQEILSLGAGVQSTVMFLMACRGEITPKPSAAIFSDTKDEPVVVYQHLEKLIEHGKKHGIPIHIVTNGRLSDTLFRGKFSQIPVFKDGSIGLQGEADNKRNAPDDGLNWKAFNAEGYPGQELDRHIPGRD